MENYKQNRKIDEETVNSGPIQIFIPKSLENVKLPDPVLCGFYQDLENRIIWIQDDIDSKVLEISKYILRINKEDEGIEPEKRKPVKILIFTYGGDGASCFSLIDVISLSKTPIYTINMGVSMSAGLLILLSGHKRFCLKNSTALAHSGSGGAAGTYESTEAQMKDYKHFVEAMRSYIMERTKIDTKLMNKKKNQEWYIYSKDQLELGIVDEVIDSIEDIIG